MSAPVAAALVVSALAGASQNVVQPSTSQPQAARGLSWLHRWMLAKGLPMQAEPAEPAEPAFIRELFEQPRE